MRIVYNLVVYLLLIPSAVYWLLRSIVHPSYRHNLAQRFGLGYPRLDRCLWIHAVSVGEVVAAIPLIRTLRDRYPGREVLVTTITPT